MMIPSHLYKILQHEKRMYCYNRIKDCDKDLRLFGSVLCFLGESGENKAL
ncbi:hypothetical protein LEP1GSC051_1895 [Leptospira sp. P2653]|nr:hypothetical protein LEP1GSC051_1895 [Leptospira sp. P2653]